MLWVKPRTVTFPFYPTPKSNIPSCKSYGRGGGGVANSLLFLPLYSLDESHKTLLEQFFSSIFWVKLRTVIFPVKLRHRFNPSGQVTFGTLPPSHLLAPNPGILLHSGHSIPDTGNKKKNWTEYRYGDDLLCCLSRYSFFLILALFRQAGAVRGPPS